MIPARIAKLKTIRIIETTGEYSAIKKLKTGHPKSHITYNPM